MRLFITGGSGLLGSALLPACAERGYEVVAPRSADFDITDPSAVARLATGEFGKFDWILNLAAYTLVDKAETERESAAGLNAVAPGYLAAASLELGARLLHFSTDYVFDGTKGGPYLEEDPIRPINFYGETKADGEQAVLQSGANAIIARVSWLYGPHGPCFPQWVVNAHLAGKNLKIVSDQFGVPSSTTELSRMVLDLTEANPPAGIYHVCGAEALSRIDYARAALDAYFANRGLKNEVEIAPVPSSEFPTPAARPFNSVLSSDKVAGLIARHKPIAECLDWL